MLRIRFINKSCHELPSDYQFNGVDVVKLICAYLVCLLHIPPFKVELLGITRLSSINFYLQNYLCRIAVPFFFTASGFFLFRKLDVHHLDESKIKNYCFKILKLLGIWTCLLFVGGVGHLWYLGSLVVAVIILSFLIRKGYSLQKITVISFILFMIGLLDDSYYGFIEPLTKYSIPKFLISRYNFIFKTTRNGFFFGLIFVLIGALFAQKRIKINNALAVAGFGISFIVMFFEVYLLQHYSHPNDFNMVLALLPTIFFLFYLATHIELKNKPVYQRIRVIGMIIFFTHLIVDFFVSMTIVDINYLTGIDLTVFQCPFVIVCTTMLAILIESLSKKQRFQWLKILFS